jgi:hypothetical protein
MMIEPCGSLTCIAGLLVVLQEDNTASSSLAVRPCSACLSCDRHKRPQAVRVMHMRTTPLSSLGMTNRLHGLSGHSMSTVRMCRMDREWDPTSGPVSKQ